MIPRQAKLATAAIILVAVILSVLTMCVQGRVISDQKRDLEIAERTGDALDKAAAKTDEIRQDQRAKENDVSKIEGSDVRLPDGYGRRLDELRKRERADP